MEVSSKPWYTSLTLMGASLVGVAMFILPMFGQADTAQVIEASRPDIILALERIGEALGLIMVVIGRIRKRDLTVR